MPFSTSVCRTAAVRKVEGACRLSCSCGPGQWPGRDVDGQENGAEGPTAFGSGEKRNHPWADWQARSSLEPSAHQAIAPGACRGWRRHLLAHIRAQKEPSFSPLGTASNTADHEGSPGGSRRQAIGGPFAVGGRNTDQQNTREAVRGKTTFRSRSRGRLDGTRTRTRRRCALGVPQGVRNTGRAADGGHGSRETGSFRSLCGRCHWYGAGARPRAWTCRIRPAACLCSRGSDCTTRTGRSCRCVGAWARHTADKPVLGAP